MKIQINNLTTDHTTKKPITTFEVMFENIFKEYIFDVVIKWNQIPVHCETPDEVACQQVVNFLASDKTYKKINSDVLGDFHYMAYIKKI